MCDCHDHNDKAFSRRAMLGGAAVTLAAAGLTATSLGNSAEAEASNPNYADPEKPALPAIDVDVSLADTALVVVDPQIDFLSENGVAWGVVGESVSEHNVVKNIGNLLKMKAEAQNLTIVESLEEADEKYDFTPLSASAVCIAAV